MKRYITPQQVLELTDKGLRSLLKWWRPTIGDCYVSTSGEIKFITEEPLNKKQHGLPLLSIVQMIEFMDQYGKYVYSKQDRGDSYYNWSIRKRNEKQNKFLKKELCDCLWRAVKEKLENIC